MNIKFELKVNEPIVIRNFFGIDREPNLGEKFQLPGNAQVISNIIPGLGIDSSTIINFILENIESVSAGVFAAYFYDKIKNRTNKIKIGKKIITEINIKVIEEAIEIENEKNSLKK